MLNRFWSWLRRLFVAAPVIPPPVAPADPVVEASPAPEPPDAIPPPVREAIIRQAPGNAVHRERAFLHTRTRIRERYGFTLNRSLWDHWNHLIATGSPLALRLRDGADSRWRIMHGPNEIFLVHAHGFVVTALPPDRSFYGPMVKDALARRNRHVAPLKTKSGSAKQAGRGTLAAPKKPMPKPRKMTDVPESRQVLPPPHKRPQRNEAYLAELRRKMAPKWDHD